MVAVNRRAGPSPRVRGLVSPYQGPTQPMREVCRARPRWTTVKRRLGGVLGLGACSRHSRRSAPFQQRHESPAGVPVRLFAAAGVTTTGQDQRRNAVSFSLRVGRSPCLEIGLDVGRPVQVHRHVQGCACSATASGAIPTLAPEPGPVIRQQSWREWFPPAPPCPVFSATSSSWTSDPYIPHNQAVWPHAQPAAPVPPGPVPAALHISVPALCRPTTCAASSTGTTVLGETGRRQLRRGDTDNLFPGAHLATERALTKDAASADDDAIWSVAREWQ